MIFKYCVVNSIGCLKNKSSCFLIEITSYFKKGKGHIFYKNFLDYNILNFLKLIIFYLNIDFLNYDFYILIKPFKYKKFDNCINLALFISVFLSFFKLNLNRNVVILGDIDLKNGKILKVDNINNKINVLKNNDINLLILPYFNNIFFKTNLLILRFNYLVEVYNFFKRCLTQRQSNVFTHRLSRVRFSQHLNKKNFHVFKI